MEYNVLICVNVRVVVTKKSNFNKKILTNIGKEEKEEKINF